MMGEEHNKSYKSEDEKAAAETLRKEAFIGNQENGPVAPEWSLMMISHDGEHVEFDGFNLNYNESKGLEITFNLPILVTGSLGLMRQIH